MRSPSISFFSRFGSLRGLWILFSVSLFFQLPTVDAKSTNSPSYCSKVSTHACEVAEKIGLGINIENPLMRLPDGSLKPRLEENRIQEICKKFKSVRLPVDFTDGQGEPDSNAIRAAKTFADKFIKCGMIVIIDNHFFDYFEPGKRLKDKDPQTQFKKLWVEIAKKFKGSNKKIVLELLNEPSNKADPQEMNLAYRNAISEIRKVGAKNLIITGPIKWGSPRALETLELPPDSNLIVGVHVYDPMEFTHQGAQWIQPPYPLGVDCCTPAQIATFSGWLKLARDWSVKSGRPVVVTEFGAYEAAKFQAREKYLIEFTKVVSELKISRMYWEYDNGFGVYDSKKLSWNSALMRAIGAN